MDTWLLSILITLGVFFAARGLMLWYWKIDKVIELLERQNQLGEAQKELLIKLLATQKTALLEGTPSKVTTSA